MKALLLTAAALTLLSVGAEAQVLYSTSGSTYAQNFDTLPNTPDNTALTWTDNSTLTGWYASESITTVIRPSPGSSNTGSVYSFGSTGSTDRALGSVASGTTGTITYGVRLTNTTGQTLTSFTLGYTGEQWRDGGGATAVPNSLTFAYSLSATGITTGTYTSVSTLNFTGPINSLGTATALDGNAAANRVVINGVTVNSILWAPGTDLWLQWTDLNDAGNDHGVALDDLSFSAKGTVTAATPEPGTVALMSALGLSGFGLLRRRRAARK